MKITLVRESVSRTVTVTAEVYDHNAVLMNPPRAVIDLTPVTTLNPTSAREQADHLRNAADDADRLVDAAWGALAALGVTRA